MFRISSSLIPFGSSELNTLVWESTFKDELRDLREFIKTNNIRISVHPGQYTVLNSPRKDVVNNSIKDLEYHVKILNNLAPKSESKMILHLGGVYGDKSEAIERFIDVYNRKLSDKIKKHLVIENDDKLYTVADVLEVSSRTGVPVVFDNLHHEINPSLENYSIKQILAMVMNTWKDDKPKVHYSQQDVSKRIGAHSSTINLSQFINDYNEMFLDYDVDIMLEVKDKNRSYIKVNQFFIPSKTTLEQEWARYKYLIMSISQSAYNNIRALFKENRDVDPKEFYEIIDNTLKSEPSLGSQINALSHVWGYFKKIANEKEIDSYKQYSVLNKTEDMHRLLKKLANKYSVEYLKNSYYL